MNAEENKKDNGDLRTMKEKLVDLAGYKSPYVTVRDKRKMHNNSKCIINHVWPENTCLIVGDSILNNLKESKLTEKNRVVKVRAFPGSNIQDMFSYIVPLLRKRPSYLILHIGTNDAAYKPVDDILNELIKLKTFISEQLPTCKIVISQPTTRNDNLKAKVTINHLINKLDILGIPTIDNSNIGLEQLGKRGIHLN